MVVTLFKNLIINFHKIPHPHLYLPQISDHAHNEKINYKHRFNIYIFVLTDD